MGPVWGAERVSDCEDHGVGKLWSEVTAAQGCYGAGRRGLSQRTTRMAWGEDGAG
jgi:hypothetical protein